MGRHRIDLDWIPDLEVCVALDVVVIVHLDEDAVVDGRADAELDDGGGKVTVLSDHRPNRGVPETTNSCSLYSLQLK